MQDNPRVGLVLMRADWFGCDVTQPIQTAIEADTTEMVNRLSHFFEVVGPWVVDSPDMLQVCQRALHDTEVDLVLLAFQTWADDLQLVSLLQAIGNRPLVVWCYVPWRRLPRPASYAEVMRGSGPVGAMGALGTLRNLDVSFLFTYGSPDDPRLMQDLRMAARAAQVRRRLRATRFGLLPSRNDRNHSTFVDEFRLMSDFGPVVQYISINEFKRVVDSLAKVRVDAYVEMVRQRFPIRDVAEETLECAAKTALGLAHLAVDYRLDLLALNDAPLELYRAFGMRPALYPDLLEPLDVIFQPEGDLGAATANYILHHLTGSPTLFAEIWFWDEAKNQVVGGHGGVQNPELGQPGQVSISRDYEFCHPELVEEQRNQGAQFQFIARPGRVTLFQLRATPTGWQGIAMSGICLEGQPWVEAYPHAIIRLDTPMETFLNRVAEVGATQHWIMAYGSVIPELDAFCQMEKIPLEVLTH